MDGCRFTWMGGSFDEMDGVLIGWMGLDVMGGVWMGCIRVWTGSVGVWTGSVGFGPDEWGLDVMWRV